MDHVRHAAIRARAYQLWIEGGYSDGQQDANWRQAEREIAEREQSTAETDPVAEPNTAQVLTMRAPSVLPHSDGTSRHPSVVDAGPGRAAA